MSAQRSAAAAAAAAAAATAAAAAVQTAPAESTKCLISVACAGMQAAACTTSTAGRSRPVQGDSTVRANDLFLSVGLCRRELQGITESRQAQRPHPSAADMAPHPPQALPLLSHIVLHVRQALRGSRSRTPGHAEMAPQAARTLP